jgi:hypothetical protein
MKQLLQLEELTEFILAAYFATLLPYAWWWYWVLFLTPDVGMLGYVINARVGALTYNLFHHKAVALAVLLAGFAFAEY